jgi:signal transduction histidine kinase
LLHALLVIDMTCHELRNPLSAMVQCADSVSSALGEMTVLIREDPVPGQQLAHEKLKSLIETISDAIDTIQACATHQRRVVDDILTLSKLDSRLLLISPITIQLSALLQNVYRMFKEEAQKSSIELEVGVDSSMADLNIEWAVLDPSRVLQVLINLITNAIKFTAGQSVRKVKVIMCATSKEEKRAEIDYVPQETTKQDLFSEPKDGDDETFYLHFTVVDTGCGLSPKHKEKLFQRFSQATPKTHIQVCFPPQPLTNTTHCRQYGGSGLGLFISRQLTEMQGGRIGMTSTQGVGSSFCFYVRSRRATGPSQDITGGEISTTQTVGTPCPEQTSPPQPRRAYHILGQ